MRNRAIGVLIGFVLLELFALGFVGLTSGISHIELVEENAELVVAKTGTQIKFGTDYHIREGIAAGTLSPRQSAWFESLTKWPGVDGFRLLDASGRLLSRFAGQDGKSIPDSSAVDENEVRMISAAKGKMDAMDVLFHTEARSEGTVQLMIPVVSLAGDAWFMHTWLNLREIPKSAGSIVAYSWWTAGVLAIIHLIFGIVAYRILVPAAAGASGTVKQ